MHERRSVAAREAERRRCSKQREPGSALRSAFGLFAFWLTVYRVLVACLLLCDLGWRARWHTAHYTDAGVLPRLASLVCYVFLASLHTRNPMIAQGGDNLMRERDIDTSTPNMCVATATPRPVGWDECVS